MNNDQGKQKISCRWLPFALLTMLLTLFFLPLLAGWEKFFFDDIAFFFYPQQSFLSRALVRGTIPWWNPHLAAGASPFYGHFFQSAISPLNWIFLILGGLDPVRDYLWLIKLPLTVSYLLSAWFSYLFCRRGLKLGRPGSFLFSLAYTLSPAMIYFSLCPPEVLIQAWLPLFCLCLIGFAKTGRLRWLILGAGAFALVSPSGDVPVVAHLLFITALFGLALIIPGLKRRDWKVVWRVAGGGIAFFGIGFLLAGVYWGNMISGLRMLGTETGETVEALSGLAQSMPPLYLVTLFLPDYFGGVTSYHTWGAAHRMNLTLNDANLLGGLFLLFLVFAGFLSLSGRQGGDDRGRSLRQYWWGFFAIFLFGILVVLGRYTPAYGFFRVLIPVLRMPYPVRFRSIECFALAGLLGVSVELMARYRPPRLIRPAVIYLLFVLLLAGLALVSPYSDIRGTVFSPGFRQLTALGDWPWFIRGPVLYLILGACWLLLIAGVRGGKCLRTLLIVTSAGELIFFSYRAFYHNRVLNHRYRDMYAERYFGPDDDPVYQKILHWRPEREGEGGLYRRLYYRSYFDNLGWLDGSLSLLGFDIKPLDPRFQGIIEELTEGFPYEIKVKDWSSRFWLNMSGRYFLSPSRLIISHLGDEKRVNGDFAYRAAGALPRLYTIDRIIGCSEEEAVAELVGGDLREGVFVEGSNQLSVISDQWTGVGLRSDYRLPITDYKSFVPGSEEEYSAHFEELQAANPITHLDFRDPNRVVIDAEISTPAMLVMTDVYHPDWRATLNGEPVPVHRVNYLQRGIWCPPGECRIEMVFRPSSIGPGLAITGAGLLALLGLIRLSFRSRRRH